jgi:Phage-related lysozyme (muraminidase)
MYISKQGLDLIKVSEGLKLKAYRCPSGIWTIGHGHTRGVYPGMVITEELADKFLVDDVWNFEREVESLVKVPITQSQFDALVSFAFNVGSDIDDDDIAEGLGDSTLLRKLNSGDILGAANEFPKWNRSRGVVLSGLTKRRRAERALFLKDTGLT